MVTTTGITVCFALLSIFAANAAAANRMVCYFGSWSVYRKNGGKFDVEDIDPTLCTHLIFGFVGLNTSPPGIRVLDPWNELYDDYGKGAFIRFNNLRKKSPGLKTLVAIGGWNEGSIKYSETFATAANRNTFTKNAIDFIKKYGFDGLDLDWEYPGQRGGVPSDIEDFTELLKTLRTEFDRHGYLLTAAVAAAEFSFIQSYDVKALSTYLDFINVMTYDFHGDWEKVTGHNAPLYGAGVEVGTEYEGFSVDAGIKAWVKYGASPDKLVLGVGMYGRTFSLASTTCTAPRCATTGPGAAGPYTAQGGFLGYHEICKMELQAGTVQEFDEEAMAPYLVNGNQWVGYDNLKSIQIKVNYIINNNLGGAMIWSIDTDDFKGDCGKGRSPLLTLLSKGVASGIATAPDPPPVTVAPIDPTDPDAPGNGGGTPNNKKMVCYFGSWSVYRQNGGKFDVEDIDPKLCTHLIFGFVGLNTSPPGIRVLDPWNELYDDYGKGAFSRFNSLRNRSPGLKTLVAIGGWNEGSIKYSETFATAENRNIFAKNAVAFIRKYGFNGLDLDWEYPGQRGGVPEDIEAFTELLKTLRTEFDKYGYLLTAAVAAAEFSFTKSYDIVAVSTYLDFINVMTYDFHGAWEKVTGHNAPLYKAAEEIGTENEGLNVDESIKAWLRYGASPEKLVLGVGMYGRSFTLSSTSCSTPRCGMSGAGTAGATTGEAGILGYTEICKMELDPASVITFDEEAKVPYLVRGNQWVGYDNAQSIQEKVDYIHNNNLGGAMIWSVDTDDWTGVCGKGTYPLLTELSNGVRTGGSNGTNPEVPEPEVTEPEPEVPTPEPEPEVTEPEPEVPTPEPEPEVTEPEPEVTEPEPEVPTSEPEPEVTEPEPEVPTPEPEPEVTEPEPEVTEPEVTEPEPEVPTPEPEPEVTEPEPEVPTSEPEPEVTLPPSPCTAAGYVRDPTDCKVFYLCTLLSSGEYKYSKFTCSGVLVFDTTKNVCNFPEEVTC